MGNLQGRRSAGWGSPRAAAAALFIAGLCAMSRSMGHLVTGLPAACVSLESAAFSVRGPVRTSKLFGDGGGSESSYDDMDDFFRHLMGKDAMDPGWAETIVQHAKDDTSSGGQGHLPRGTFLSQIPRCTRTMLRGEGCTTRPWLRSAVKIYTKTSCGHETGCSMLRRSLHCPVGTSRSCTLRPIVRRNPSVPRRRGRK